MITVQLSGRLGNRKEVLESACLLAKDCHQKLRIIWILDIYNIPFDEYIEKIQFKKYKVVTIKRYSLSIKKELIKFHLAQVIKILYARIKEYFWLSYQPTKHNTFYRNEPIDDKGVSLAKSGKNIYICSYNSFYENKSSVKEDIIQINSKFNSNMNKNSIIIARRKGAPICGIYSYIGYLLQVFLEINIRGGGKIVVDMQNYINPYIDELGVENAWEFFYQQPDQISLKDVTDNIIYSDYIPISKENFMNWEKIMSGDETEISKWSSIYYKYVHLQSKLNLKIEQERKLIKDVVGHKKVLGVKFRSTDYKPDKIPALHFLQADISEMIQCVRTCMDNYGYEYIFLAVEEEEVLKSFQAEFENKVLNYDCKLISNYTSGAAAVLAGKIAGKRQAGEDYIVTISILADCDALIASANNGTIMSIIMNDRKYEHIFWVNNGKTEIFKEK